MSYQQLITFLRPAQSWVGSKLTWGMDDFTRQAMKEHG